MPNRTPTQEKAIAWYAEQIKAVPQLSTHPIYYFKVKETGETTSRHIEHITNDYKESVKEDKKAKKGKTGA